MNKKCTNKAIFLDRDGVINYALVRNGKPFPPRDVSEVEIIPRVKEGIQILRDMGFFVIVVTNQPDVASRKQTRQKVEEINEYLMDELPISHIYTCYHDDTDRCNCRKPKPGLLLDGARDFDIDLRKSYMVGDRWRDIEAGAVAGCKTIFIDYGYDEQKPYDPDYTVKSLWDAIPKIIG